jgi:hypothetical protein
MAECHPIATPVDSKSKLFATDGAPVASPLEYRSLASALQYLTLTRPDIAYAIQQVCLFMHDPRELHLALIKRILRYVKGTLNTGLHLGIGSVSSITAYSDADWAGCPLSTLYIRLLRLPRRQTGSLVFKTTDHSVSPMRRRSTELAHCCWLRLLLEELHISIPSATTVYCDNVSTIYMTVNPVHHRRMRHIKIDIHFVRKKVALGQFRVLHVPSAHQFTDIMTKGLPIQLFNDVE